MSTETIRTLKFTGLLYTPQTYDRSCLITFSNELKKRGLNIHGLIQENAYSSDNQKIGFDGIDLKTDNRIALSRPSKEDLQNGTCGLDVAQLADCAQIIERSIEEKADLLIVEKFGEREQNGEGLMDEIFKAAMADIPTLVTVPYRAKDQWTEITGGLSDLIVFSEEALWNWWEVSPQSG